LRIKLSNLLLLCARTPNSPEAAVHNVFLVEFTSVLSGLEPTCLGCLWF